MIPILGYCDSAFCDGDPPSAEPSVVPCLLPSRPPSHRTARSPLVVAGLQDVVEEKAKVMTERGVPCFEAFGVLDTETCTVPCSDLERVVLTCPRVQRVRENLTQVWGKNGHLR